MKHLIDITDLSLNELDDLLKLAEDIIRNRNKYSEVCKGKKLATLFYEPSTRTRLSFEAAMMELGGNVLGFSSASSSSVSKGESVADPALVVSKYADLIAMRHPKEGAPYVASLYSEVPVINAGDGGHNHPTQTLTDLLTIRETKGRLDNLTADAAAGIADKGVSARLLYRLHQLRGDFVGGVRGLDKDVLPRLKPDGIVD